MTAVEKHIRHFNLMNGNEVRKATLQKFLSSLPDDAALNTLKAKLKNAISKMERSRLSKATISFTPLTVPEKPIDRLKRLGISINKSLSGLSDYQIKWNSPDDWELDEDTDVYKNAGETKNFLVELERDNIVFIFKDRKRQKLQIKELGNSIKVNLEHDNFNRIHINGISRSNKGKGFGKEIYSAMVYSTPKGIISTANVYGSSTDDAQRVWDSLIKSGEFYSVKIGQFKAIANNQNMIDRFIENIKRKGWENEVVEKSAPGKTIGELKKQPMAKHLQKVRKNRVAAEVTKKVKTLGNASTFRQIPLDGDWAYGFNRLFSDTQIMIWGMPGSGKTVILLKFSQYLSEKGLAVLYVAREEYGRSTFDEKINEFNIGHPNLKIVRDFAMLEKEGKSIKDFDAVFLDSVNRLGLSLDDYIALVEANPNKIWVPIVQSNKDGSFKGGQDWEHEVDIAGQVINRRLVLTKNRLDKDFRQKADQLMFDNTISEKLKKKEIDKAVKAKLQPPAPEPEMI